MKTKGYFWITFLLICLCSVTIARSGEAQQMEPEIVELTDMTVVGMQSLFSTNYNMMTKLWERFSPRMQEIKHVSNPNVALGVSFGMIEVKPEAESSTTKEYQFFHLVGMLVTTSGDIPEGMTYKQIPAHRYAKFTHKGPIESTLDATYDYIFNTWLPQSGYQYDDSGCDIEWYDERFSMDSEDSEFDIYVPIK
jgi:AraC family transcriptional regulator